MNETDRSEAVAALAEGLSGSVVTWPPAVSERERQRDRRDLEQTAGVAFDYLVAHPDLAARVAAALRPEREELDAQIVEAALRWRQANLAYMAALDEHSDWSDERKQTEIDRDPAGWFGPSDRANESQRGLVRLIDARLAESVTESVTGPVDTVADSGQSGPERAES